MKHIIVLAILVLSTLPLKAAEWTETTHWYRVSATSDNRSDHKFKVEENTKIWGKTSPDSDCQFFLFYCGFEERFQDTEKICRVARRRLKQTDDVAFSGSSSPNEFSYQENGKYIDKMLFINSLEPGGIKSFKLSLGFNRKGKLSTARSKIFLRQLISSKLVEDDSSYKNLSFENNAVYFELGARCPIELKK
jgi:hypothetical protein